MKMDLDFEELLDGMTRDGMKKFVKRLMSASDSEEKRLLQKLNSPGKNDLADLDEEMHGKPNAPKVTEDDLPYKGDDELPDVPKKGKKNE
jgi:hypothetical protein